MNIANYRDDVYREYTSEREPSINTKRQIVAEAAEKRQNDFKQGGAGENAKTKQLKLRREKEIILGHIQELYVALKEDPPIGLASCNLEQLKTHYAKMKNKKK